jgi:acetylornithine deacetylase/succinyl-diaminopimelate desuccinylase-like protein
MKDMDAMMLTAVAELLRAGERPRRDTILAFFADEENGGVYGSQYLIAHHPELFAGATTAISEVGGYSIDLAGTRAYLIQTGEKSLDWIRLRARGTAAHGSMVWHDNAVTRLAEAVAALGRHEWPVALCDTTRELVDEIAKIFGEDPQEIDPEQLVLRAGAGAGFILASLRTTTNPTVLQAGYKHNVIPDTAEALIDVRTLPESQADILAEVQRIVGPDIEIENLHSDIGLEAPFGGELIEAMTASLQAHDPGARVLPYLLSGGTDNKALSQLGITGYGFAPLRLPADLNFPGMFHGVDERVPLDALDFGHRVLVDLLRRY